MLGEHASPAASVVVSRAWRLGARRDRGLFHKPSANACESAAPLLCAQRMRAVQWCAQRNLHAQCASVRSATYTATRTSSGHRGWGYTWATPGSSARLRAISRVQVPAPDLVEVPAPDLTPVLVGVHKPPSQVSEHELCTRNHTLVWLT